jgi:hypothetical protein
MATENGVTIDDKNKMLLREKIMLVPILQLHAIFYLLAESATQ